MSSHLSRSSWLRTWAAITATASVAATCADAVLLQLSRSYFTGGFLASDYVTRPSEAVGFLAGSLLLDLAFTAVPVAFVLWVSARMRARRGLAVGMGLMVAVLPLALSDVAQYQLTAYLGDAFDLQLLFDLAGRSLGEFLAVSSEHVFQIVSILLVAVVALVVAVWVLARVMPGGQRVLARDYPRRAWLVPAGCVLVGLIAPTVLRASSDVLDNGLRRKPSGRALGTVVQRLSDVDGDGAGIIGRPPDPDLFDSRVRPYAPDIPGNGIDEDGVGGDLPSNTPPYTEPALPTAPWMRRPDVVLIVLESFRADARGAVLNGKPVTPNLDGLAARGVVPAHAYSHNGYTVQSRRHIFTGSTADIRGRDTLVDDFKRQGYQVAYFSAQDESFGGNDQGVGFDRADVAYDARADRTRRYSDFSTAGSLAVPYQVLNERVAAFLDAEGRDERPLFLYLNYHDTHFPYHHAGISTLVSSTVVSQGAIAPRTQQALREMYLNTAANVDRAIGEALAHVRRVRGREPGVVVVSDHGESLYDDQFLGHGYALDDAQTRIPFITAGLPLRVPEPVTQSDLRVLLTTALSTTAADAPMAPTLDSTEGREVFQYLGLITRPAQIAFTSVRGRLVYDFRERRVRMNDGAWQHPDALDAAGRAAFLRLLHTWERMMLAR